MADAGRDPERSDREPPKGVERRCRVCDAVLSSYNPGPNCWAHTIGQPWRGPTAPPKF